MTDKIFIDSNIWIYLLFADDYKKYEIASSFISSVSKNGLIVISPQVINEVTANLKKKKYGEDKIRKIINMMFDISIMEPYSRDIALEASIIREQHLFSFWDSQIIASAIMSNCKFVASEDMQSGRNIKGLIIKNIFSNEE